MNPSRLMPVRRLLAAAMGLSANTIETGEPIALGDAVPGTGDTVDAAPLS